MNIFKILANGDGTINEANISAFLGYLLDPYQDHGLGHEFLDRIMQKMEFLKSEDSIFNTYKYEYEVLFEQAFRDEDKELKKKEIVDIVILCFETNKGNYKELIAATSVEKVRELKYIILLENKVSTGAKTVYQLKNQYENTVKSLNINQDKVISIYVTPDDKKYIDEFNNFTENQKKIHLVWIADNERNKLEEEYDDTEEIEKIISIYKILKEIITDESNCKIEAINEYTKHTLISFIKFIENDFKSQIKEKQETKERKNDGSYTKAFIDLNEESNIYEKLMLLRSRLIEIDPFLNDIISLPDLSQPRHPFLNLMISDVDLHLTANTKDRNSIRLFYQSNNRSNKSFEELELIAKKLGIEIKKANYKNEAYTGTEEMKKKLKIDDTDLIYNAIKIAIKNSKKIGEV